MITASEEETSGVGRRLAERLHPGSTVLLFGDLGAGKTALVRGLAEGLGIDPGEVSSPTFTLVQEYRGRVPLYHVDLYRVAGAEIEDLGLEDLGGGRGVLAIEWADRLPRPVPGAIAVRILDRGGNEREIAIELSTDERR